VSEEPPLDSPCWLPIPVAIERRYKQTGDYRLVAEDLNEPLRDGRLRSLSRRSARRERLPKETWQDDLYVNVCLFPGEIDDRGWPTWTEGVAVFSRVQHDAPLRHRRIFIWAPDLDAIWLTDTPRASNAAASPPQSPPSHVVAPPRKAPKPGSAEAWIVEMHRDKWHLMSAGKIWRDAANRGCKLTVRSFQRALKEMRNR
jgi:hypothetical protein